MNIKTPVSIAVFLFLAMVGVTNLLGQESNSDSVQQELPRLAVVGTCMGPIPYSVIVVDPPEGTTESTVQDVVDQALQQVNLSMSTYLADSDVSRFNRSESTDWFPVDKETAIVVARALEISQQTEGAFDITVGPAVNLWKFGPDKSEFDVPTDQAIKAVQAYVGYQSVQARLDPPAIRKDNARIQIDLSAIAKGYAVDQVAVRLNQSNHQNYMIEVGGEVRCRGVRHTGEPWRVGIPKPVRVERVLDVVLELTDRSMATSGDYENFHRVGKKRFSHTIDPKTCRPVTHFMASASIIAKDCMTADALATASMVLGRKQAAKRLQEIAGVDYFLVERESAFGEDFTKVSSPTFPVVNRDIEELNTVKEDKSATGSFLPVFIASVTVFGLVILAMAVGAIFNNKPVQGSCGGIANVTNEDGESSCSICSKPTSDCVEATP